MPSEDNSKPKGTHSPKFIKSVNIQHDGRQYSIRIPIRVVKALKIKKGDKFTFQLEFDMDNKSVKKVDIRFGG